MESKNLTKDIQNKIVELVQSGEILIAKDLCISSLRKFPEEMCLYIKLSSIFESMGDINQAQKCLEKNPDFLDDLDFLNQTMRFYLRNTDYYKAQAILDKVNQANYKNIIFKRTVKQMNIVFNSSTKQHEPNIQLTEKYIEDYPNDAFGYLNFIKSIDYLKFSSPEELAEIWDSIEKQIKEKNISVQVIKRLLKIQNRPYSLLAINDSQLLKSEISEIDKRKLLIERLQILLGLEKDQKQIENLILVIFSTYLSSYEINVLLALSSRYELLESRLVQYIEHNPKWLEYSSVNKQFKIIKHCHSLRTQALSSSIEKFPYPIDVVYTWCDMDDLVFVEKFKTQNGFDPTKSKDEATGKSRYINNQEIKLSIVSLFKYFNTVNKIYIVTNEQQFELDFLSFEQKQKVYFINHLEIMPKKYIKGDVFNSNLIETFLWNIPKLEEYFLYFCDDMVLGNYLKPHHLFDQNNNAFALINPRKHNTNLDLESFIDFHKGSNIPWTISRANAVEQFIAKNAATLPIFNMHQGKFLIRSQCKKAFYKYLDLWQDGFFQEMLRGKESVYSPLIYLWEAIIAGKQKLGNYYEYNRSEITFNNGLNRENIKHIQTVKPLFYCINHVGDQESQKRLHGLIDSVSGIQEIPYVYELVNYLARKAELENVIYIGNEMTKISDCISKNLNIIEINSESDLVTYAAIKRELEAKTADNNLLSSSLKIEDSVLEKSLILCSNIIERLSDPTLLVDILARWSNTSKYILISTPEENRITNLAEKSQFTQRTLEHFHEFLSSCNFPIGFYGHTISDKYNNLKSTSLVISGKDVVVVPQTLVPVTAIINCYNEADIIEEVVLYLINQNVNVVVVDNWSNDGSYEIVKQLTRAHPGVRVARFPDAPTRYFHWNEQLINTVKISEELGYGWYIHYDADEIRLSPWQNVDLQDAISFVDSLGYNAIDFTLLNFRYIKKDQDYFDISLTQRLQYFEFGDRLSHFKQIKAWKYYGQKCDLNNSGGHQITFENRKVYPIKFLIKHYPLRSQEQASKKLFQDRFPRFPEERQKLGWHGHYDHITNNKLEGWNKSDLILYNSYDFSTEYLVERISDIGIHKLDLIEGTSLLIGENSLTYLQAIATQHDDWRLYFMLAKTQKHEGDLEQAIISSRKALELDPENVEIIKQLSNFLIEVEQISEALSITKTLIDTQPDNPRTYLILANIQHKQNDLAGEIYTYQELVRMFPDNANAKFQITLGNKLVQAERSEEAIAVLSKTIKLFPEEPDLYFILGKACFKQQEYAQAITSYAKVIELNCQKPGVYFVLGQSLREAERLDEAIVAYQSSISLKPGHFRSHTGLGHCYREQQELVKAISSYQKSLDLNPDNAGCWFVLGQTFRAEGNKEQAIECYQKALDTNHSNLFTVYKTMGTTLKEVGETSQAITALEAALKIKPNHPEVKQSLYQLGVFQGIKKKKSFLIKADSSAVVCVLGMHRSGTSCLAGSLQASGLSGGKVFEYTNDNQKGNKENTSIMALNQKILTQNGGSWDFPPENLEFTAEDILERNKLIDSYNSQFTAWMFKDPRTVLTLPFWQEGIPNLKFIGTFRHPLKVAMSLYQRQEISIPLRKGLQLWIDYNSLIVAEYNKSPFPLICFDLTKQEYLLKLQVIINDLNQKNTGDNKLSVTKALEFYESYLVHQENISILNPRKEDAELIAQAESIYQDLRLKANLKAIDEATPEIFLPMEEECSAYLNAIKAQPNNSQLYFMLANIKRDQGDLDAAISLYKTALKIEPKNINVVEQLCKLFSQIEQHSEALALVTAQIKSQPEDPRIYLILGNLQRKQKNFEGEISTYQQLIRLVPQNYNFYVQLGNKLIRSDRSIESITLLNEALKLFPQEPDLYFVLGRAHFKQQEYPQAITFYDQAIELNYNQPASVYIHLGLAFVQLEQKDKAMLSYQKAIQIQPDHINAHTYLGNYYRGERDWDNAIFSYARAIELNCQNPGVYFALGQSLREADRLDEAIVAYQSSTNLNPEHFQSHMSLGHCYRKQQNLAKAISSYQKSLDLNPDNAGCWFMLGQTLRAEGNEEQAIDCYQKALDNDHPNLFAVYKTMGITLKEVGKNSYAITSLEAALKLKPNHPEVKKSLSQLRKARKI